MKKLFLLVFTLTTLGFVACSDDNDGTPTLHPEAISAGPDFLDTRDSTTYRTVRVGNQLWLAQNLRYALPGYSIDGVYTWNETMIDKKAIKPDDADLLKLMTDLINDPQYNGWPITVGKFQTTLLMQFNNMVKNYNRGRLTVNDIHATLKQVSPQFEDELSKLILKFAELPHVKAKVGKAHFEAAERANKGYSTKYGLLYTYDAALSAVPEGWRLPTDEDWLKLEETLGLSHSEALKKEAWRGEGLATLLTDANGFAAEKAGANAYTRMQGALYINRDQSFHYWTATREVMNDSIPVALIRQSAHFNNKVWRGTSPLKGTLWPVLYSVRCVKDL